VHHDYLSVICVAASNSRQPLPPAIQAISPLES
jgi:hypothetical protein